jgi:hypothetical protein
MADGMKNQILLITLILSILATGTQSFAQNCELVLGANAQRNQVSDQVSEVDLRGAMLLKQFRDKTLSSQEDLAVRQVTMDAFYGKHPIIYSLDHLLAYDRALRKRGLLPTLAAADVKGGRLTKQEQAEVWKTEQRRWSNDLKVYAAKIKKMSERERRTLASEIMTELYQTSSYSAGFVAPEAYAERLKTIPNSHRLPRKQVSELDTQYRILEGYRSDLSKLAIEEIVYESLIPLSRLAINDRLEDRVGGRKARQVINGEWLRVSLMWLLPIANIAPAIILGNHFGGAIGVGEFFGSAIPLITAGYFASPILTSVIRTPESVRDGMRTIQEGWLRSNLWRKLQKQKTSSIESKSDLLPEYPSEVIETQFSKLEVSSLDAGHDWNRIKASGESVSVFGEELQLGLNSIVNAHMNVKFEEIEQLQSAQPLIKVLQKGKIPQEVLKKSSRQLSEIDRELRLLNKNYFKSAQLLLQLRNDLSLLDQKLKTYIERLEEVIADTPADQRTLLETRLSSLVQTQKFVEIQFKALVLTEKSVFSKIQAVEDLHSIMLSAVSGLTIDSATKIDDAFEKLSHLLQPSASGVSQ